MLVLTRRVQEAFMVGDDVTITILSVNGNQVRIGIDAPREVEVHREEVYKNIQDGTFPDRVKPTDKKQLKITHKRKLDGDDRGNK